ncbi:hypothetical protein PLEOSDRAFT_1073288 [Pleurotus ostreatus PC15]|uniref:Uncharacterized protein n=1 Tax=Pleurotus ostreatus (strain PC15) TaxID=1137138 RepID=A0A067NXX7_PLEO1|nr:hypothetical protein PLEOSDRAFT_1073288 [Pleurotus ostreatus PC15]
MRPPLSACLWNSSDAGHAAGLGWADPWTFREAASLKAHLAFMKDAMVHVRHSGWNSDTRSSRNPRCPARAIKSLLYGFARQHRWFRSNLAETDAEQRINFEYGSRRSRSASPEH